MEIHSIMLNFVKLLYLIFWDARTNLIRFYWNLHRIEHLTWISKQFFVHHNIPKSSEWIPRSNNGRALQVEKKCPRDSGCSVPDGVKQKSFLSTLGSQITKDFVWKSKAAIHSFTFNFVKLLYLITWDARANLIRFYWNLHHLVHLVQHTWFSNIKWFSL